MRFGILVFPGTWSDHDCLYVLKDILNQGADLVWHQEKDLSLYDGVVLPGGFSYGDYLRCGAIARFSPVMQAVADHAEKGKPVIGICNGFQILCESGLLPGVLLRNESLQFRCQSVGLLVVNQTSFTSLCKEDQVLEMPISHGEGRYFADSTTIREIESSGRVVFRYCNREGEATADANPNGSTNNIAGVMNKSGNVLGMMPHPERASEELIGGADGAFIWRSIIESFK